MDYEIVIGLEVHTQLKTDSKLFCNCVTTFGAEPNTQTCPVCLGMPGVLPVMNQKAFEYALKVATALNCNIAASTKFDRKNYFYPDLPKNYQISQYDIPIAQNGWLEIGSRPTVQQSGSKKIGITRVHLEEDAGKLIHLDEGTEKLNNERTSSSVSPSFSSLVDLNRAGVPLVEIVSQPEITSPDEAYQYLIALKSILIYLGVSDCDMEKGSLRCDANISLRKKGDSKLGTKTEVKNLNSFKAVAKALEFEANRQATLLNDRKEVVGETRLWDEEASETRSMRSKEEIQDYRYFPEPDLMPFTIFASLLDAVRKSIPELPTQRKERFIRQYQLSEYDAGVLLQDKMLADYFEECVKLYDNPKSVSNWLAGELMRYLNDKKVEIGQLSVKPDRLVGLLKLFDDKKITSTAAKDVWAEMLKGKSSASEIVSQKGLSQISDDSVIEGFVKEVISKNEKIVGDYKGGKKTALEALLGQVMKVSKGKAQPDKVRELLKKYLDS
ncbi:MAG: Asp-tRNA(Asn)/Glu-tRNA(Gln) amidotransferase subunit GatB [Planctomycetota bacterium]